MCLFVFVNMNIYIYIIVGTFIRIRKNICKLVCSLGAHLYSHFTIIYFHYFEGSLSDFVLLLDVQFPHLTLPFPSFAFH